VGSGCSTFIRKNATCSKVPLHFVVYAPAWRKMLDLVVVQEVLSPHSDELLKLAFLLVDLDNFDSMWVVLILVRQLQRLEGLAEVQKFVREIVLTCLLQECERHTVQEHVSVRGQGAHDCLLKGLSTLFWHFGSCLQQAVGGFTDGSDMNIPDFVWQELGHWSIVLLGELLFQLLLVL
jgi:hypothetical protein